MPNLFALGLSPSGKSQTAEALKNNQILIGWARHRDLRGKTRNEIKDTLRNSGYYTGDKIRAIDGDAGKIFRFINEINIGDYVICPTESINYWYCAIVTGNSNYYKEYEGEEFDSANRRSVIWLNNYDPIKLDLPQEILRGIKSSLNGTLVNLDKIKYSEILHKFENFTSEKIAPNRESENISQLSDDEIRNRLQARIDAQIAMKIMGERGEEYVFNAEVEKLKNIGRQDLAKIVEHTSRLDNGDAFGYDIRSFDEDGNEIFIEVKTTPGLKCTPFYMSSNQIRKSHTLDNYFIYRLYNFEYKNIGVCKIRFHGFEMSTYEHEYMDIENCEFLIYLKL